jgi:uncharacterized membrane protein YfcA
MELTLTALLFIYLLLGILVGLNAGFIGGGGGFFTMPVLIYTFSLLGYHEDVLAHTAVGTSLFVIMFTAASGSIVHIKRRTVYLKLLLMMAIFGAAGAWSGGTLSAHIRGEVFIKILAVALIIISIILYRGEKKYKPNGEGLHSKKSNTRLRGSLKDLVLSGILGFLAGFASAFFGIGGSIVMLPASLLFLRFSLIEAISHATCLMTVSALVGVLAQGYYGLGKSDLIPYSIGYVNYAAGITMAVSGIFASRWAAKKVHLINHQKFMKVILVLLFFAAIGLLLK